MGSSVGVAVTYPMFGLIIKKSCWENVFHFCGVVGTIWYIAWLYFVYDLPESHPRIDPKEKEYILTSLGSSVVRGENKPLKVPWLAILTSRASWMNIIAQWGGVYGLFTLIAQAPSYFRFVHGWGIEMTGILSGLPHLFRVIFSLFMSTICDHLLATSKMSRTNVRKLATFFSEQARKGIKV
jgi:MFS transporter, ACS family, solute carrier family 17 (sodium-dependent inorganic phosphate cotransporter), member 5